MAALRPELPRVLVLLGIGFMILGAVAIIGFVAGDSTCNAATNLSSPGGVPSTGTGSFCGHAEGLLGASFAVLVVGALLLTWGAMVMPTLRARDARRAAAAPPVAASTDEPSELRPENEEVPPSELEGTSP